MSLLVVAIICAAAADAQPPPALRTCETHEVMPRAMEETAFSWLNGWDGDIGTQRKPASPQWVCAWTGEYAFVLDAQRMTLPHFGAIEPKREDIAVASEPLPEATLSITLQCGDRTYRCLRGADKQDDLMNFPVRLIEGGRFVQRFDILNLVFEDKDGQRAPVDAQLEIIAWPGCLSLLAEATPTQDMPNGELHLAFAEQKESRKVDEPWKTGVPAQVTVSWAPHPVAEAASGSVVAKNLRGDSASLDVSYDPVRRWHRVALPKEAWNVADDPGHLDRIRVELSNPSDKECVFPLLFAKDEPFEGVTGMCPMIRDEAGEPTGIPVQISKNWHRQQDRRLRYEGPWFHGFTMLRLPAQSRYAFEFTMAYARWGGVPSASHAQLCLIGWGHNQVWDQAAIGSWGESICYEPDAIQKRCRITDVRPLMVRSMSANQPKWTWTNNVGGGDFLVYYDADNHYQSMKQVYTRYVSQGPCLTRVEYHGVTMDDCIKMTAEVSLPRCDDVTRVFHKIRYDVLKPTRFKRLAFYQLGADDYNWHTNGRIARGNETGLIEEWKPSYGGRVYDRTGIPCEGTVPWFAMLDTAAHEKNPGAWANRGIVVRAWKARVGGHDAPAFPSVFRSTSGNFDSALIELSPPPDVSELQAGDYVEAEIEMVIMPTAADDYYGPNEALRKALESDANTWKMFHREATGNHLDVECTRGTLSHAYPLVIAVDKDQSAEFTVSGGVGYAPITFSGLAKHDGDQLVNGTGADQKPVDQSVHGNDFWQTDYDATAHTWSRTYNVNLDGGERRSFSFRPY